MGRKRTEAERLAKKSKKLGRQLAAQYWLAVTKDLPGGPTNNGAVLLPVEVARKLAGEK